MIAEKKAALPAAERIALDTPAAQRTAKQNQLAMQAEEAIRVGHDEVTRENAGRAGKTRGRQKTRQRGMAREQCRPK